MVVHHGNALVDILSNDKQNPIESFNINPQQISQDNEIFSATFLKNSIVACHQEIFLGIPAYRDTSRPAQTLLLRRKSEAIALPTYQGLNMTTSQGELDDDDVNIFTERQC